MTDPAVLICDEPTSSLDVSVQAQIVNLLLDAKRSRDLSLLFVSHDLDLIGRVADKLVVMYRGRVMESGPAELVRSRPRHPYTKSLHDAVPADHPAWRKLTTPASQPAASGHPAARSAAAASPGMPAVPAALTVLAESTRPDGPAGRGGPDCCVFASRCPAARARCYAERPPTVTETDGRSHACFFPLAG